MVSGLSLPGTLQEAVHRTLSCIEGRAEMWVRREMEVDKDNLKNVYNSVVICLKIISPCFTTVRISH